MKLFIIKLQRLLKTLAQHVLLIVLFLLISMHAFLLEQHLQKRHDKQLLMNKKHLHINFLHVLTENLAEVPPLTLNQWMQNIAENQLTLGNNRVILSLTSLPTANATMTFQQLKNNIWNFASPVFPETLSIQLTPHHWLNYHIEPVYSFYTFLSYLIVLELVLLGLYLFYIFSLQRFKAPLNDFKNSANKLGMDVNSPPVPIFGPKIVRNAIDAMNKMQSRIQALIQTRTQILAAISHDLRNPITKLKLRAQYISDPKLAEKIQQDLSDMELMVNGVLNFANEDNFRENKTLFDIVSLLNAICEDFLDQNFALHTNITIPYQTYFGRRLALKRTFINLIQNGLKYGEEVWVTLQVESRSLTILIEDRGPGIPEDEINNVLKPFYRTATARSGHAGFGLGLTVAHEIISDHQGSLQLQNCKQGGLQVKIVLPLATH